MASFYIPTKVATKYDQRRDRGSTVGSVTIHWLLGWKAAPDRFIKSGRSWIPKWRFAPLIRLDDAFELLNRSSCSYKLERADTGTFAVEVQLNGQRGEASGEPKARTITLAIARALGLEVTQ